MHRKKKKTHKKTNNQLNPPVIFCPLQHYRVAAGTRGRGDTQAPGAIELLLHHRKKKKGKNLPNKRKNTPPPVPSSQKAAGAGSGHQVCGAQGLPQARRESPAPARPGHAPPADLRAAAGCRGPRRP